MEVNQEKRNKSDFDYLIYSLIKKLYIMKHLKTFNESREEREGTFDYFMTKSKEELLDYQKNFQHSFENPAEHDPKFVAWKKACEVKKCFDKESFPHTRKESEFPSKMIY